MTPPDVRLEQFPRLLDDRYALRHMIGRGGMAVVMTAYDRKAKRRVAVKILHPHLAGDSTIVERFELEARAARGVEHPNLVGFLDAGIAQGIPYLVMELVEGPSLADYVNEHGALRPPLALELFCHVALALEALHAGGVVHRDVKPANLLLEMDGLRPRCVKVADLGLVRVHGKRITGEGQAVGTSSYMAPEQAVADEVDPRTDIYALGVCLFFALTAELPFTGSTGMVMCHQLLEKAPPPSWLIDEDPLGTDTIVGCALRKAPANRYATMHALRADSELAMKGIKPLGVPLVIDPDRYVPATRLGRDLVTLLAKEYRKKPPSWIPSD